MEKRFFSLEPKEKRLVFRGKEKEDEESFDVASVKDMSKVLLLKDPTSKERKLEEMERHQCILNACEAVANMRAEVDLRVSHCREKVESKAGIGFSLLLLETREDRGGSQSFVDKGTRE
ncbi:BAG family molecular chaperone regulator 1 [Morella rubra]|uniref:BAG family molecular chaperone regulator 1 n=1 Tax=Morella rubra TaxID=262757 RepID=A0A6A1VLK2_9ROSI|nr:BAG family molecular chaperone regulator 1 [Morella rubra]